MEKLGEIGPFSASTGKSENLAKIRISGDFPARVGPGKSAEILPVCVVRGRILQLAPQFLVRWAQLLVLGPTKQELGCILP